MLLFINSVNPRCGVYQYGRRVYTQLECPDLIQYAEIGSPDDLSRQLQSTPYSACILNYHPVLFPWWSEPLKTYYLYHESSFPFNQSMILNTDPTHILGIPRPLSPIRCTPSVPDVPTFGSFGFGFENKGFERIISIVQSQYDTAHIRFVIPYAAYGDATGSLARDVVARCRRQITKPGITLQVSHEFMTDEQLVAFLASNTMNVFLYDPMHGRGCSSVLDFALVAGRPIAISDSSMFRHVYSDAICAYKRPLHSILADGDRHIRPFVDKWTPTALQSVILDRVRDSL